MAIGQECLFLTDGDEGFETLKEHIRTNSGTSQPAAPLQVSLQSYDVGAGFAWAPQNLRIDVDSKYQRMGIHYDVVFSIQ